MLRTMFSLNYKMSLRNKARLNICIAKDIADTFGGSKADYLKRLNQKLRNRSAAHSSPRPTWLAKAA
jgi:hypothetical protein